MGNMVVEHGHCMLFKVLTYNAAWKRVRFPERVHETWYVVGDRAWMESERNKIKRLYQPRPSEGMEWPRHEETVYCDHAKLTSAHVLRDCLDVGSSDDEIEWAIDCLKGAAFEL